MEYVTLNPFLVILSPFAVILSNAKDLSILLRAGFASLSMTVAKGSKGQAKGQDDKSC